MISTDIAHGTVGAVALDTSGDLAAATSTGGTFGKLEGRIGDTPLIGPGTWADDNIAISCTGTGEHIIRAGGATAIAFRYRSGVALTDAIGRCSTRSNASAAMPASLRSQAVEKLRCPTTRRA